jgi:hypothetical protein
MPFFNDDGDGEFSIDWPARIRGGFTILDRLRIEQASSGVPGNFGNEVQFYR